MTDVLCINKRYWQLNGDCDPVIAKGLIKDALRKTNTHTELFIATLNGVAGHEWVGRELFTRLPEDYDIIYSSSTNYLWNVTLTGRKVELREKIHESKRRGHAWHTLYNVAFSKS